MKRYYAIFFIILLVLAAFIFRVTTTRNVLQKSTSSIQESKTVVTIVIDDGSVPRTYTHIVASTAYAALLEAVKQDNLEVKSKQYDFGVFVEEIGAQKNTKEKSWIYFVNDVSGDVAADKKNLTSGDTVSWRYVVPTVE